jgi:hypothetical protein
METLKNINRAILSTLLQIEEKFPELSKYIGEMPDSFSEKTTPQLILKNLEDYNDSLALLLKKYAKTHTSETQTIPAFLHGRLSAGRHTLTEQNRDF